MRDIPIFSTELGVASLILNQIPYTKKAYIRIQDSGSGDAFLQECCSFCKAAGAESVYGTGHACCEKFPTYTRILKMQMSVHCVGDTDASLFPVTESTLEQWRDLYNKKVVQIPNGSYMTLDKAKELLQDGDGYFVHRNGELFGIGKASGDTLHWVASLKTGAGQDVVRALCHALSADTVYLEVSSENHKAMKLYDKLGFVPVSVISEWYQIF